LKLYREHLSPKLFRWIKKRLHKIRRTANDARDLDVLANRLERDYGARAAPIIELIAKERAAVQPAIVRVANRCRDDDRFVRKSAKLLLITGQATSSNNGAESAPFRVWAVRQFAQIADQFAASMPNEVSDTAELHQFRICAKALRYAIELVSPAFGPELREELYPIVEEIQERLGRIQDHVTAIERCRGWMSIRDNALQETLEVLADSEHRRMADSIRQFRDWWTDERVSQVCTLLEIPACSPGTQEVGGHTLASRSCRD
jgi:CHAD domain-containing protein